MIPGPDFTVFWNQCAQQGYQPKAVTAGKVGEFPQGVYPYGDRAVGFVTEVWWSKFHPFKSSLTGQSSMEFNDEYERVAKQHSRGKLTARERIAAFAKRAAHRESNANEVTP